MVERQLHAEGEIMMRSRLSMTLLLALSMLLVTVAPTAAQETTEPVTCDATLMTLLLVAVQDYGYEPSTGYAIFNFAQYRPLAEVITGQPLPLPNDAVEPSAGQQAQSALQDAAADLEARGWGALGQGLADISDEIAAVVEAGDEVLQQGQAAIQAGAEALQNRNEGELLTYGTVPGQHDYCDLLRVELVDFMTARLNEQHGIE